MAVRQYVGARYVPQIMGDWNDQTVYEPLSVVTYNFGSYTSKKAVPAGVKPTNEEYWALTGQYNAQVEEYRQEVEDLKSSIHNFKDRYFLLIGDSYAVPSGNFYSLAMARLGIPATNYWILAEGGIGIRRPAVGNNPYTLIQNWVSSNPGDTKKITDVYVCLGYNNAALDDPAGEVLGGIQDIISLCRRSLPNSTVTFGMTGVSKEIKGVGTSKTIQQCLVDVNADFSWAPRYGGRFIPMMSTDLYQANTLNSDNFHPNSNGQTILSSALVQDILRGPQLYQNLLMSSPVTIADGLVGGASKLRIVKEKNVMNVTLDSFNLTSTNLTMSANPRLLIGSIANNIFVFAYSKMLLSGFGGVRIGGTWYPVGGPVFSIESNNIYLVSPVIKDSGFATGAIEEILFKNLQGVYLFG